MANNIKKLRLKAGLSQPALAERMGTTKNQLIKLENGQRQLTLDWIGRVAKALNVAASAVIEEAPAQVPVVGSVMAGDDGDYVYGLGDDPGEFVDAPETANDNTVAVRVRGQSLGRAFDGWLLFYDDVRSPVATEMYGQLCVVQLTDDRTLVKIIMPSRNPGLYHLFSNANEDPILDAEVVWAALVKDMRRR